MYIVSRSLRFIRGAALVYGPSAVKKRIWNKEYSEGKWNFIDNTAGDCVYPLLEKYAREGDILDLGCGPGNTASELPATAYRTYLGVDISDACLIKARARTNQTGRSDRNTFVQGDLLKYLPDHAFNVILLRESLYHVSKGRIPSVLHRYSGYLKEDGVFIVRVFTSVKGKDLVRPREMMHALEAGFHVVERNEQRMPQATAVVLVFQPKSRRQRDSRRVRTPVR